jgi:hypothetical protein
MTSTDRTDSVSNAIKGLLGLQLFKSWNIFGTRMFYFAASGSVDRRDDGDYRLTLECPWRIEQDGHILVGYEDYGERAEDNLDPEWDPKTMQHGHLQDAILTKILGSSEGGAIFNSGASLIVESVHADAFGGFQLGLSGGYKLSVFPAGNAILEWLVSRRAGGTVSLSEGAIREK